MVNEKRKILIVDDEADVVDTINSILSEEGFETHVSNNGHDALQKVRELSPELVLLDCYLPEMMGIEVLREIRKSSEEIAVVMMTGHGEEQLVVALMKAGASDYLKKPLGKFTLLSAVKDVLRKKDINREIIQSERLLLLGELFPFVAHEIRNPLHAIGGALTIIQKRIVADPLVDQSITVINEEIKRLNSFVKECLEFSNPSDPSKFSSTDINDIIASSVDLMMPAFYDASKQIEVSLSLQENLPRLQTNFNEIKQVVLNVIKNAVEAIDEKGNLGITTSYDPRLTRNFLTMQFSDTGKGIKKEIAKKIFDPFFTTKTSSGGTGLGLSVCRKIICENHRGTLTIDSEENRGTTVTIRLPVDPGAALEGGGGA
jgi:signal transduction histidine kinase